MKRTLLFILTILLILSLCACSNSSSNDEVNNLKEQIAQLQEENSQLKERLDKVTDSTNDTATQEDNNTGFVSCSLGEAFSLDFVDVTVDSASWYDALYPSDTSGVYSYYEDIENESFFALCGIMKNTSGEAYSVENIVAQITFDSKYTYKATLAADDGSNNFYGDYVDPLSSIKYYIYASIPDELRDSYSSCEVRFGFADNFSGSPYDEFDECNHLYTITLSK